MDRRDFIKSGLLAAAVGAVGGPKVIAQEAERQAAREQLSKDILNYNPQMPSTRPRRWCAVPLRAG